MKTDDRFRLHSTAQQPNHAPRFTKFGRLDLRFLEDIGERALSVLRTSAAPAGYRLEGIAASVRNTIAELDLTYYIACRSRGRTIAYLGVSRTTEGDFLSSDDVELLVTLSGYVAIAIENSRLYHSLQRKADEYERLKEFSENIVESISVGILAADLETGWRAGTRKSRS